MRIYACAANQGNKDTMSQGKRPFFSSVLSIPVSSRTTSMPEVLEPFLITAELQTGKLRCQPYQSIISLRASGVYSRWRTIR